MSQLARDPKVLQLAKDLGLNWRGDCLTAIRQYALAQVDAIRNTSPIPIIDLDTLRRMVADKLSVRLEFVHDDSDIERIVTEYSDFSSLLRPCLVEEFVHGSTEGITLQRDEWDPRRFRYLAVVDARAERAARAYFTAWHELAHLLVHPSQLPIPGFRRTQSPTEREKDPVESVVDHVAGRVAFYPPLFGSALQEAIDDRGGLDFEALEAARVAAAPTASLFATAMGSIQIVKTPSLLVSVDMALKAEERRFSQGSQTTFDFAESMVQEKLRVTMAVPNERVTSSRLAIRRNMRVPVCSVLARVHASTVDIAVGADEDQGWWETSSQGSLAALPIRVEAAKRGRYVYGLITPLNS